MSVTVTGGAGYVGATVVDELLAAGREVKVLDSLLHGQEDIASELEGKGVEVVRGDIRDAAARAKALEGAEAVVHLAAIVGDPACAKDPALANEVNVEGSRALVADARAAGVARIVFASTCSNYGRMSDPMVPIDESGELAPVSLYAEQKVGIEKALLEGDHNGLSPPACASPPCTASGRRMRFDLTVNEFTRDLWAEQQAGRLRRALLAPLHPRPRCRPRGRARARRPGGAGRRRACSTPATRTRTTASSTSWRSSPSELGRGDVELRAAATRTRATTRSRSSGSRTSWASSPAMRVPTGVDELVGALEQERFGDPFDGRYSNI